MAGIGFETSRLRLLRLNSNAEDDVQLGYFHNVWRDEQATQWSPHGPCKDKLASQAWMAGVIPSKSAVRSEERVCYAVLLRQNLSAQKASDMVGDRTGDDASESIGILTLLPATPINHSLHRLAAEGTTQTTALELGYLFLPSAWGKGFATESIRSFLEQYHSNTVRSKPHTKIEIQANVHPDNIGSLKVLQKLGFTTLETVSGEGVVFIGGASRSNTVVKLWKNL